MDTTLVRVKVATRDKLKRRAGDATIADLVENMLRGIEEGDQLRIDSLKGEMTFADVKMELILLRRDVAALTERVEKVGEGIAELSSREYRTRQMVFDNDDRVFCLENGLDYNQQWHSWERHNTMEAQKVFKQDPKYQEWLQRKKANDPTAPGRFMFGKKAAEKAREGLPTFSQWLRSAVIRREKRKGKKRNDTG